MSAAQQFLLPPEHTPPPVPLLQQRQKPDWASGLAGEHRRLPVASWSWLLSPVSAAPGSFPGQQSFTSSQGAGCLAPREGVCVAWVPAGHFEPQRCHWVLIAICPHYRAPRTFQSRIGGMWALGGMEQPCWYSGPDCLHPQPNWLGDSWQVNVPLCHGSLVSSKEDDDCNTRPAQCLELGYCSQ